MEIVKSNPKFPSLIQTGEGIQPDTAAEDYLAALLVQDVDCREKIVDSVTLDMFATEPAQSVFAAVSDLMAENLAVDASSLSDALGKHVESADITVDLLNRSCVSVDNVDHYIARVRENHERRRVSRLCETVQRKLLNGEGDLEKLMAEFEDQLLGSNAEQRADTTIFGKAAALADQARKSGGLGYSWGLPRLDKATRGIVPGYYYAIGGLKKTGKTLFGISTIANLAGRQKVPCLVFSLEMSSTAIAWALLSRETGIDSAMFGTSRITDHEMRRIDDQARTIEGEWPLYVDNRKGLTTEQIIASIRRHARKGVKVVLIDYLQRIDIPNRTDNRATAIQKAINKLADAAQKYNVAILIISQLANRAEFEDTPNFGDFKESGGITEACDCAIILRNVDRSEGRFGEDKSSDFEIIIGFQRVGESGIKITLRHDLKTAHFYEIDSHSR